MGKKTFRQFTWNDRIKMETMLNMGHSKSEVAEYLHIHRSNVYREFDRGKYVHRNSDYTDEMRYSSDLGQRVHDLNKQKKGRGLKIGKDRELADYIEDKIVENKYSPAAALADVEKEREEKKFKTRISLRTLYRYIDAGIFLRLTNKHLPVSISQCPKTSRSCTSSGLFSMLLPALALFWIRINCFYCILH